MQDFSDDVDYDMDSAFLAEIDAIEAAIEPVRATPAKPVVAKPTPNISRPFPTPNVSKSAAAPFTPAVPKAPPPASNRPAFRPSGRSTSSTGPSVSSIRNAVRSALVASQTGSQPSTTNSTFILYHQTGSSALSEITADSQNNSPRPAPEASDPITDIIGKTPTRRASFDSIPSPSPGRKRAISVHSSDDYSCYDIPEDALDEIEEIAESALTGRSGSLASNATRQMNLFGGVAPQTPGASGSGARGFASSAIASARRTVSKNDGLFGRPHHRQQTKSWDYVKAAEAIKSQKGKGRARDSEGEDDEELEQFPDFTAPLEVSGGFILPAVIFQANDVIYSQSTKMQCKPDPKTIENWIFPLNKEKRDYQYNIISRSLFDNTLVSLPTGLGKTFIAGSVMLNFYTWFPTGKVVFVAPTKPLVAQQIEACHESCGIPGRDAIELTGTVTKNLRRRAWEEKRVFYMTPQTFFNDLKDGTCDAEDIVLVVIDEAHRATGSYAYVTIVHYLMARNPHHRILALSATPGKNSETVQSIVDGLHISRIEIRDENSMDLQKYIFKKHTDIQIVAMNDGINDIKASLVSVMNPLLKTVQTAGCCNNADPETMNAYRATAEITSAMHTKDKNKMRVLHPLKSLAVLARAMGYLVECSVAMCERVLKDFYESGGKQHQSTWNKNTEFQATLNQISKYRLEGAGMGSATRFPPHPKMEKLNEILVGHFDTPDANETRVMVFTNFRESVDEIVAHLNSNESGKIKAHRFIGQAGGKGGDKGMSQKEQLGAIKRFKSGEFNVLVATSIGEEGLDIGEIDLIVCYDAQKAPVRMLQRVGRTGRKREGKVVVLLAEIREERNWEKAKESYRDVQQAIIDGSSIELFNDAARMVPEGVQPQCIEKRLDIEPYDREVHGDLTGKRLRTKAEGSTGAKKRKRNSDVARNVPEGALLGFITAANLTVRKKNSKKKATTSRADGLDSDDDAIEAGVFGSPDRTLDLDDDEDTPAHKRTTKAKTPATRPKPKPRKSTTAAEDSSEPLTLSQPAPTSPKKTRRTKSTPSTTSKRSFSTNTHNTEADMDVVGDTLVLTSSDAPLKSSPLLKSRPAQPMPFPLGRKPVAPPSSPIAFSLNIKVGPSGDSKDETHLASGTKDDFSLLLSDSDIEILDPTPPRMPSPQLVIDNSTHTSPLPNHNGKNTTITFTSPASPRLDPPTDSPDRSFPLRPAGRSTRMTILDSSPLGSPSMSQRGGSGEPSTPPRRRIRRGRPPSPEAEEAEVRQDVRKKGKKTKRSILEKNRFLETEAQFSGSEDSNASFDPAGLENDYDREFVRTSPLTQVPADYNQQQYYVQSLMTQVPGGSGPRFATGPVRYNAYLALGNKRREGVSSSPVRVSQSQYVNDSFVVDDEEEIEYEEKSSDLD
ncbi:P-loop containing nucleoside triphosphate hydrolase protein [Rhizoctonia solani]|uniref:ATP-dependent DNA helicase n=1 Tax=Rhizoctonia solani TaxID=456999 RepID=A0A8H7H8E8_9AGAM|nr:P-loop containing nucleoside triphosphate hydrolase protein [Rhizoctonia solani]